MLFKSGFKITQKFGNKHPIINGKKVKNFYSFYNSPGGHNGIDLIPKDNNFHIYAPTEIKIVYLANNYDNGYGAYLKGKILYKGSSLYIYFCHLDTWDDKLKVDLTIPPDAYIGVMGGSGNGKRYCFGRHLHFGLKPVLPELQVRKFAGYINPIYFIKELC